MHELPIVTRLMEGVTSQARERGAARVVAVNLAVGEQAGLMDDSLRFYFDMVTPDTVADGARLNIRHTPMRFQCESCESEYTPSGAEFACPKCAAIGKVVDEANDVQIESIEVAA